MCCKMEYKVLLWLCFFIGVVRATEVNMSSEWKPNFGWLVTCSWRLYSNDSLLTVRLSEDDRQFKIYRLIEGDISETYPRSDNMMMIRCTERVPRGIVGSCVISVELYQPQTRTYSYSCEVSGERPKFRQDKKSIFVNPFVPPTDAIIQVGSRNEESGRVTLNCSASGLPAPRLLWTVGGQKVPADFSQSSSNATSKLYDVWSILSYTYNYENLPICTPEINWAGETITGVPATYNAADVVKGLKSLVIAVSLALFLGR